MWGCSSAGRALPSQGRGREFKSLHLHHHDDQRSDNVRPLFLFSPFRALFSPAPLGNDIPAEHPQTPFGRRQPFTRRNNASFLRTSEHKRNAGTHARQPLNFASSSALLLPTPAPHALSMAEAIRSHRALRPCIKSAGRAFPLPPAPDAVISAVTSRQTAFPRISPTCPRQRRACRTAPRLPIPPVGTFPFHGSPNRDEVPSPKKASQKFFLLNLPARTGQQTADVFSQKALLHKRCQTLQQNAGRRKGHRTWKNIPGLKNENRQQMLTSDIRAVTSEPFRESRSPKRK